MRAAFTLRTASGARNPVSRDRRARTASAYAWIRRGESACWRETGIGMARVPKAWVARKTRSDSVISCARFGRDRIIGMGGGGGGSGGGGGGGGGIGGTCDGVGGTHGSAALGGGGCTGHAE